MKVFYDGVVFRQQREGGINRYFREVIGRLPAPITPYLYGVDDSVKERLGGGKIRYLVAPPKLFRETGWGKGLEKKWQSLLRWRRRFDLFHPTYYTSYSLEREFRGGKPLVVTIYDMIAEFFPEEMDPEGREAALKERAVGEASAVICISENTKRDLLGRFPEAEGNTTVIPLATHFRFRRGKGWRRGEDTPYFLFVGGRIKYKNFKLAAEAMAGWKCPPKQPDLYVVGDSFFGFEKEMLSKLGIEERVRHLGPVNDGELAELYAGSVALLYPSLYEGFGIPALEAMACGTAVIAAKRSSLPEVVGEAGLLIDPESVEDLQKAMASLMENEDLRRDLIAKGEERLALFSWEKTAAETVKVYESLVG